jgi:hypothetical protein
MVLAALTRQVALNFRASGIRSMGSTSGQGVTYAGVTVQPASTSHVIASEAIGGLLWSWLLIRFYEDGEGLLFGHTKHLDHELHELQRGEEDTSE